MREINGKHKLSITHILSLKFEWCLSKHCVLHFSRASWNLSVNETTQNTAASWSRRDKKLQIFNRIPTESCKFLTRDYRCWKFQPILPLNFLKMWFFCTKRCIFEDHFFDKRTFRQFFDSQKLRVRNHWLLFLSWRAQLVPSEK